MRRVAEDRRPHCSRRCRSIGEIEGYVDDPGQLHGAAGHRDDVPSVDGTEVLRRGATHDAGRADHHDLHAG